MYRSFDDFHKFFLRNVYVAANGGADSAALKSAFMKEHLDKEKCYEFDDDLMQQILMFYDSCCGVSSN